MGRRVVQLRPGDLNFLQLPQAVFAKVIGGALVYRLGRVHSELAVQARPGEPQAGNSSAAPQRRGLIR